VSEKNPFAQIIRLFGSVEASGSDGALAVADAIGRAADLIVERREAGALFVFAGNGASASMASHMAADSLKNGRMRAIAFTDGSLLTCLGNDLSFSEVFAEPIRRFGGAGDVFFAISSSGRSPNIVEAADAALALDMHVLTLTGFDAENPLRQRGELNFYVPSHEYGDVESVHAAIAHRILDTVFGREVS
jgi:D-sedoheptulose 7-phosphate isomerase